MKFYLHLTRVGMLRRRAAWFTFHLAWLLVAGGLVCSVNAQQHSSAALAPSTAVLDQYCVACHNHTSKAGGLSLKTADGKDFDDNPEVLEKVVTKLRHRFMPPTGLPRPDELTYDAVVSSFVTSLDRAAAAKPNPGRTPALRRLNRTEYRNAIRDLLAVDVDVSSLLPSDDSGHGFDNVTVGELSPTLLERYLSAAQKISRTAVGSPVRSPGGDTIVIPPEVTQERRLDGLPFGTRGGTIVPYSFPLDAEYVIQIRLSRDRDERVEGLADLHRIELMLDGERVKLFTVEPVPVLTDHQHIDKDLNVRIPVKAGPREIGVTFLAKTSALVETARQPYQAFFNAERHPRSQPAIYSISILGPYDATGPGDTPSRRRVFACRPAQPSEEEACAKQILLTFMRRAYRRPVTGADIQVPFKFYQDARVDGEFDTGIEMALRAILVNPQFLFRIESDAPGVAPNTAYRVTDLELASRLSFFLWSSVPDDELLDVADRGKLREPAVLEKQVRRMLADARSEALWNNFAAQWLYLRNLASANPDPRLFPDFDDNLRQAFRRETELLFESIVREDRNVLDLLRARYTFLNERLAKHYGIPRVYGSHFRRVTLGADSVRGGLLGHGSILTVTSYANRTSPVIRGQWVLANLLGTPPPPPPPEVPALRESTASGKPQSMRERVTQHRANPVCASCHDVMDPVGFALENYDAIGRWRTAEGGMPVDASGSLPGGANFDGALELQQVLLMRPELFVSTVTEKLLTYALGRGLEYYDAPAVREVVRRARDDDYRFSSLILGVVNSEPFQARISQ